MSLLALTLLFGLISPQEQAAAQNGTQLPAQPSPTQWDFMSAPRPQFSMAQANARQRLQVQKRLTEEESRRLFEKQLMGGPADCYALRVYTFRRQDGNAPVLVGTTTCTPSDIYRRKNAGRPPVPKLIPLSY